MDRARKKSWLQLKSVNEKDYLFLNSKLDKRYTI